MKTFNDLKWRQHPNERGGHQGLLFFPNGYGVSVVNFRGSYTTGPHEWEVAVLKGTEEDFKLTYSTPITEDVLGHQTESDVTSVMKQVQELKSK